MTSQGVKANIFQLCSMKEQLEKELQVLSSSIQQLQALCSRYKDSLECVESQERVPKNAEVLVPLTDSIYVPGTLVDSDKFLVELGTGYFFERDRKSAVTYFEQKVAFVNSQIVKYTKILQEKVQMRDNIVEALDGIQKSEAHQSSSQQPEN